LNKCTENVRPKSVGDIRREYKTYECTNTLQTEMYVHYISTHSNFAILQAEK